MDVGIIDIDGSRGNFWFVESRAGPRNDDQKFPTKLGESDSVETDFIGVSQQDCQKWALEQQSRHNFIEQNIIAIIDRRSVEDDTVIISYFNPQVDKPLRFGRFGPLPKEGDTWYDFRVKYQHAADVWATLANVEPDVAYPAYFGLKEELTDERGVFDNARARCIARGEEPAMVEGSSYISDEEYY